MIKVKADVLRNFIIKATANGLVKDIMLDFSPEGLIMDHKDENGVVCICGVLDKKVFSEYEEMRLGINSSAKLLQALKTFKDNTINIIKKENMAKFQDENGGIDIALAESVVCFRDAGVPGLEYDNTILVKKSMIDNIIEKSKIVDSDEIEVLNKDKTLYFNIGKESDKATSKAMSGCEKELKSEFNLEYFNKLTSNLDLVFDLSLSSSEVPSKISEKNDKYALMYFLTPLSVVNENRKKEEYEKNKKLAEEAAKEETPAEA